MFWARSLVNYQPVWLGQTRDRFDCLSLSLNSPLIRDRGATVKGMSSLCARADRRFSRKQTTVCLSWINGMSEWKIDSWMSLLAQATPLLSEPPSAVGVGCWSPYWFVLYPQHNGRRQPSEQFSLNNSKIEAFYLSASWLIPHCW